MRVIPDYSVHEVAQLLGAQVIGNVAGDITEIVTDSRTALITPNTLFVAIKGINHDGHDFIGELFIKGIRLFLVEEVPSPPLDAVYIVVKDSLSALQELAAFHRSQFNIPVIGITGSNGKTIVKEWLSQLLLPEHVVVKSPKSYNSQIGVPLSVWGLHAHATMAIFEAGISRVGEMERLERIIHPTIGIFTGLGPAHDENFKDSYEKVTEKTKLFKDCTIVVYCEDIAEVKQSFIGLKHIQQYTWSKVNPSATYIVKVTALAGFSTIVFKHLEGGSFALNVPFTDDASIENTITCWVSLMALGYSHEQVQDRFQRLSSVAMRLEMKAGSNNCMLINDSYNSDLTSLGIALSFLQQQKQYQHATLILSDIIESGKSTFALYSEVARLLSLYKVGRLIGVGANISAAGQANLFGINSIFYPTTAALLEALPGMGLKDEIILIKGARTFGFERVSALLQQKSHETVIAIDVNAIVHNLNYYKSLIDRKTKVMAMVKASSYGSGSLEIANLLQFHRVDYLAVAFADEGVGLRKAGITLPIMVLNPEEEGYDQMIAYGLEPEVFSLRILQLFLAKIKHYVGQPYAPFDHSPYPIHLKLDTGMHRLGIEEADVLPLITALTSQNLVKVSTIFTHLSSAEDHSADAFTLAQLERFSSMSDEICRALPNKPLLHALNSAGISRFPGFQFDMVRIGIGLYGIGCTPSENQQLRNVHTLRSIISQVKFLQAGDAVGYNRSFIASGPMRIATVPIGYADGLSRKLSNGKGALYIHGQRASIVGKVCMDMCMVDITDIPSAQEGDEVIVFGKYQDIRQIALDAETIPYEILTSLSARVKRVYYQE